MDSENPSMSSKNRTHHSDIPVAWDEWTPTDRAVLCFIRKNGSVLLIRKKRGLGAGKVNAPGGRIERGESALEAAVRETEEEVGLTPVRAVNMGELSFQFTDGYGLHCTVFVATDYRGTLQETEEADPFWCAETDIPYGQMWKDDQYWLPSVLSGIPVRGRFAFDEDTMLTCEMQK